MAKVRVLVAVQASPFARVIEHLFRRRPDVQIVEQLRGGRNLATRAGQLLPDVIVANLRVLGKERWQTLNDVKRSSPDSKLIVICPTGFLAKEARANGADAYLEEEAVVQKLLAAIGEPN